MGVEVHTQETRLIGNQSGIVPAVELIFELQGCFTTGKLE